MSHNILNGTRVYLSGPMDFVGSRLIEKYLGWRMIITPILKELGVTVLDPWNKPSIRGYHHYGIEKPTESKQVYEKDFWTNSQTRAQFETDFWQTVHLDLRMVDLADFLIVFAPTNIYSVGTVHEVVIARNQHKPALFVSPPVKYDFFPEIKNLSAQAKESLKHYGLKENPHGIPSQWYGNIVGGHNMFDGFGWEHLPFKSPHFYPDLFEAILETSKPQSSDPVEIDQWKKIQAWLQEEKPFSRLTGGILEGTTFSDELEKAQFYEVFNQAEEQNRTYFWYNHRYTPKRSVLYQIFSIACGFVPPKLSIVPELDEAGNVTYHGYRSTDDNWLLISTNQDQLQK